jgi:hypothetical protein
MRTSLYKHIFVLVVPDIVVIQIYLGLGRPGYTRGWAGNICKHEYPFMSILDTKTPKTTDNINVLRPARGRLGYKQSASSVLVSVLLDT